MTEDKQDTPPELEDVDVASAPTIYVDNLVSAYVDPTHITHLEFGILRAHRASPSQTPVIKRYITARLAVSPFALFVLQKKINEKVAELEQRGISDPRESTGETH
jgi:hypothetical protein